MPLRRRGEDAVSTATSQVGDRDTLGAIVGGIAATATGAEGIPFPWRASIEPVPAGAALEARAPGQARKSRRRVTFAPARSWNGHESQT